MADKNIKTAIGALNSAGQKSGDAAGAAYSGSRELEAAMALAREAIALMSRNRPPQEIHRVMDSAMKKAQNAAAILASANGEAIGACTDASNALNILKEIIGE